jgi:cell division inhibitor SulA
MPGGDLLEAQAYTFTNHLQCQLLLVHMIPLPILIRLTKDHSWLLRLDPGLKLPD